MHAKVLREVDVWAAVGVDHGPKRQVCDVLHGSENQRGAMLREQRSESAAGWQFTHGGACDVNHRGLRKHMRRQDKRRLTTFLIIALVAGASYFAKKKGWIDEDGEFRSPADQQVQGTWDSSGKYEILRNCTLAAHRNNDGDSFDVLHNGKKHTVRLYFVDAPEKYRHKFNGKRISEQANYFGIDDDAAIDAGMAAREYTLGVLGKRPFDVSTKWEAVYDSERIYAFVQFRSSDADDPQFLSEQLVKLGLARIHTKGEDLPNGTPWKKHRQYLRGLEATARGSKKGAWGK